MGNIHYRATLGMDYIVMVVLSNYS